LKKLLIIFLSLLALTLISPLVIQVGFFRMPAYSASFDCDDGTLLMMERLQSIGIASEAILGNLKMTEETYGAMRPRVAAGRYFRT
jgi:hypothetical protein